jgi:tetratricopeptide (TPR) repeat protein
LAAAVSDLSAPAKSAASERVAGMAPPLLFQRCVRRIRGLWGSWLTVVVVVGRLAGAADEVAGPTHTDADGGRGQEAPSLAIPLTGRAIARAAGARTIRAPGGEVAIAIERGARFVWPDLDAPCYGDPGAAPMRLALKEWRNGTTTLDAPPVHGSAAARYLAADVTYLRALVGRDEPLAAIAAYERALRAAPGFADAPRALIMVGFASLDLGLAPEAETAFGRALAEHGGSAYDAVATLGRAIAQRVRRHFDDARATLARLADPMPAAVRCDVLVERGALARATGADGEAVALDEALARACPERAADPDALLARADSLVAVGRRADGRAVLTHPDTALEPPAQVALLARMADLAREDGDFVSARAALDRALGLRLDAGTRLVVQGRVARLDGAVGTERALATLGELAARAGSTAVRTALDGIAADTLADAGRFDEALARLAPRDGVAPAEETAVGSHRDALLARWIAGLTQAGDAAGVVTVYATHRTTIDTRATPATARLVAEALAGMGLPEPALRVLQQRDPGDDAATAIAIGEAAVSAGDLAVARAMLARRPGGTPALAAARARLVERLGGAARPLATPALVADDVPPSLDGLADMDDPLVRRGAALVAATRSFGRGIVPVAHEVSHGR